MTIQDIQNVQERNPGYLLNGSLSVPDDPENGHYQMIQAWIALGNTPDPAPAPPSPNPAIVEIERIAEMIPQGVQQITLDDNGEAIVAHNINSLWYSVFMQPIDCNMPNVYIEKAINSFSIVNGKKNNVIVYRIEALLPPTGNENLIFLEP